MIKLKRIRYKNFLSSGDKWTEIALDETKHTLIVGQNGSGKSTILDALSFGLFGKAHRNINVPQIVNSINKKRCVVEIDFTIGNKVYKVIRGLKPKKFEIYQDGVLLNQDSHSKQYQKLLENNILGLNHKTFHQVVVLGSSSFIPFMQLTTASRREVIEDILDIGVFSKMNMLLKEKNATLKEQIRQTGHAIEINDTKTEAQKKYIRDISKINNDARKAKEDYISEAKKEIEDLTRVNADKQSTMTELQEQYSPLLMTTRDRIVKLNSFESEFNTKIRSLVRDTQFYEENENCPTCEQTIDEELKEKKMSEAKSKALELQEGLTKVQEERDTANEELTDIEAKMEESRDLMMEVQSNLNAINRLQSDIDVAKSDIESLTDSKSDLARANEEFDVLMKEHHDLLEKKAKENDQYAYNSVIAEMLKDSGIKTKIIKQYIPIINRLVNQYLQVLDFYVSFELDESFTETIRSRHRDEFTYDSFSEGEKQRIDLALLFTWRHIAKLKNSIHCSLLILDETFDSSLDEAGIENLMKILHTLDNDTRVFIISHKGEILEGKFPNKIEFRKEKNFSKMVLGK